MNAGTVAPVAKLRVGQDTPWGPATAFCRGGLDGRWACASHGVATFADGVALAAHVDAWQQLVCLIVWRCRPCAEPHGWGSVL